MANFVSLDMKSVIRIPEKRPAGPRAEIAQKYRRALCDAVVQNRQALRVNLTERDRLITNRNRIMKAARDIGIADTLIVRKVRNEHALIAYNLEDERRLLAGAYAV